jgi:hypothetical protein
MVNSTILRLAPLALVLSGCIMTPRLAFTQLNVERPIFEDPAAKAPVAFAIDPRIQDTFVAKSSGGIKDIEVTEFRKTIASGVRAALASAQLVDAIPAQGLGISLVDVRPSAVKVAAIREGSGAAQYTNYEVKCEVTYGVSFLRDGAARNVVGKVVSRDSASTAAKMGATCANGLEAMFAELRTKFVEFQAGK